VAVFAKEGAQVLRRIQPDLQRDLGDVGVRFGQQALR
jgi:hypothetical protein